MSITINQKADNLSNRTFATDLLIEFKQKNIDEGMNATQALWLHHRTRAWPVTFMGMTYTVDLMNMCQSGDLETVYISLAYGSIDDMSMPYHWFNQARVDWLKLAIAKQLGWA